MARYAVSCMALDSGIGRLNHYLHLVRLFRTVLAAFCFGARSKADDGSDIRLTQGRHGYKIAAMVKTITYAVEPILYVSDLRFILLLVFGLVAA